MFDYMLSCLMSNESSAKPRVPGVFAACRVVPVTREYATWRCSSRKGPL